MDEQEKTVQHLKQQAEQVSASGHLDDALRLLDQAETEADGVSQLVALVWRGRANVLQWHNLIAESFDATLKAVEIYERFGTQLETAIAKVIAVYTLHQLGREEDAIQWAKEIKPDLGESPIGQAALLTNVAKIHAYAERFAQAEEAYVEAYPLFIQCEAEHYAAHVQHDRGLLAAQQGEFERARQLYAHAYGQLLKHEDMFMLGRLQFNSALLEIDLGNYQAALDHIATVRDDLKQWRNYTEIAYIDLSEGRVHLALDDQYEAQRYFQKAFETFEADGRIFDAATTLLYLSQTKTSPHQFDERWHDLEQAKQRFEQLNLLHRMADIELEQATLLADKGVDLAQRLAHSALACYIEKKLMFHAAQAKIILAELDFPENDALILLKEAMKTLLEYSHNALLPWKARCWVGIGWIHHKNSEWEEAERAYRNAIDLQQTVRHDLHRPEHQIGHSVNSLSAQKQLLTLFQQQKSYRALFHVLEQFKSNLLVRQYGIPSLKTDIDTILAMLSPETAILSYYTTNDDQFHVLLITQARLHSYKLPCRLDDFAGKWERRKRHLMRPKPTSRQAQKVLGDLWEYLFSPIESELDGKKQLLILPHDKLYEVPFSALYNRQTRQYAIEKWQISITPSLAMWQYNQKHQSTHHSTLLVGYAGESGQDGYLPHVKSEIEALTQLYDHPTILTGSNATVMNILDALSRHHIIHIAGHINFDSINPTQSSIPLANSERLCVSDLYSRSRFMNAQIVILSGCVSGRVRPKGHNMIGLLTAFHYAGAKNIIAALWDVDDSATAAWMNTLHIQLQTMSLTQAVQQTHLQHTSQHPSQWSAWQLF